VRIVHNRVRLSLRTPAAKYGSMCNATARRGHVALRDHSFADIDPGIAAPALARDRAGTALEVDAN